MSFITGVPTECLFTNVADGTALATFTAEASLTAGWAGMQPMLPAGFFYNLQQGAAKALRIRATGIVSSTVTPTYKFFVRIGTTQGAITGASLLETPSITTGSTITNAFWELEGDVIMRTMGFGSGAATLQASGSIVSTGFASPFTYIATPAASATAWTVTVDASQTLYLSVSASCSASNAANTVQLRQLTILGLN
jgi:hypothetical protein